MSDQDDRQVPFWRAYQSAVMGCLLPEAHNGVSKGVMRAVWRCYADHANNTTHIAYPSRDRVAAISGFSTKQVSRAVAALAETGWLEIVQPARQHSSDVCRVIIQGGHGVPSEVYPDIQTRHHVPSEVQPRVLPEVHPESRGDTTSSRPDFEGSQGGHHVPLTILTNQELVVDAHEGAAATATQQVEDAQEQPLVVDYGEQDKFIALEVEITNELLELYKGKADLDNGRKFVLDCLAYKSICPRLGTPEGIREFFEDQRLYWRSAQAAQERVPANAHQFVTWSAKQSGVEAFKHRRAPIWESEANRKFELAEIARLDRERKELEELLAMEPVHPPMTQEEIDRANPFIFGWAKDDTDEAV